jgi:iron complex transport system permease protein
MTSEARPNHSAHVWLITLTLLAGVSLLLALATGSEGIELARMIDALQGVGVGAGTGAGDTLSRAIIVDLRLPRALAAFGCGGLLACAGILLQALLRNPLADPFVLGISSGSGAMTLAAMLLGAGAALTVFAGLAGAVVSLAILFALAWQGGLLPTRLLLAGVMLSAAWGALVTLLLALAPDAPLRGMVFWLMGDLAAATMQTAVVAVFAALVALACAWPLSTSLDALGRGEAMAKALGVRLGLLRAVCLLLSAGATAVVVLTAGSIGFIGLVVPHLLRLVGLRRHRVLLPAGVLGGGTLLVLADVLARSLVAPLQLPVGALTALLGAPVFLWLLTRSGVSR